MNGKRPKVAATQQHVLKPVTAMPQRGRAKRQQYVDVSSSDSEQHDHQTQPQSPQSAIPPTKQPRTRIPFKDSAPPPVPEVLSPVPKPASPPPLAKAKQTEPASRSSPRSKRPRPAQETYAHTVHVSRHRVEQEWIPLSAPLRAHLRSQVEHAAKETLETVSAGRSAHDRAMRKHLEATFARFAKEFDDLMATLPVPPLPPGLPPNLLGPPRPGSESKSSVTSSKKKKKLPKQGEDDEPTTAAGSTSAERSDIVGDGSDWSLEALEAYLAALEKRAEQAEAAAAAAAAAAARDEEAAAATTVKARAKAKATTKRIEKQQEEVEKEEAPRPTSPKGKGNQRGLRSRRKIVEEDEEETVAGKRVRKKKQGTS